MKNQEKKNKPFSSKNFQFSIRQLANNFQTLILIIIILILIFVGYQTSKNKTTNYKFEANNTEVEVVESAGENPIAQPIQDKPTDSTGQQLGPATVEDLGGNPGDTNLDQLLKDKQIELNQ